MNRKTIAALAAVIALASCLGPEYTEPTLQQNQDTPTPEPLSDAGEPLPTNCAVIVYQRELSCYTNVDHVFNDCSADAGSALEQIECADTQNRDMVACATDDVCSVPGE